MRIRLSTGTIILLVMATIIFSGLFAMLFLNTTPNTSAPLLLEGIFLILLVADIIIIVRLTLGGYIINMEKKIVSFGQGFTRRIVPVSGIESALICERKDLPGFIHDYKDERVRKALQSFIDKPNGRPSPYYVFNSGMNTPSNVSANFLGNIAGDKLIALAKSPPVLVLQVGNELIARDMSLYEEDDCLLFGEKLRQLGVAVLNPVAHGTVVSHRVLRELWEMTRLLLLIVGSLTAVIAIAVYLTLSFQK